MDAWYANLDAVVIYLILVWISYCDLPSYPDDEKSPKIVFARTPDIIYRCGTGRVECINGICPRDPLQHCRRAQILVIVAVINLD